MLFNVVGSLIFLIFMDYFIKFVLTVSPENNIARQIANAHTAFNVLNTLLFLPFAGKFTDFIQVLMPGDDTCVSRKPQFLNDDMIINLDIGRERSIKAIETAMNGSRRIFLVAQREATIIDPTASDMFTFGIVAEIKQLLKLPNGALRVLVEGLTRAQILSVEDVAGSNFDAIINIVGDINDHSNEVEALKRMLVETFEQWVLASKKITSEVLLTFKDQPDPGRIADMIAGYLAINISEKEKILEANDVKTRMYFFCNMMSVIQGLIPISTNIDVNIKFCTEHSSSDFIYAMIGRFCD